MRSGFLFKFSLLSCLTVAFFSAHRVARCETPEEQFEIAAALFNRKLFNNAADKFRRFVTNYPTHPKVALALYQLGEALLAEKNYYEAQDIYRGLLGDPKAAPLKAAILLRLADACYGVKEFANAIAHYEQVLTLLEPHDKSWATIQLRLGHSYYNDKKDAQAIKAYSPLFDHADANIAAPALYFSAGSLQLLNRSDEAVAHFQKILERFPQHILASKALLRLGEAYPNAAETGTALIEPGAGAIEKQLEHAQEAYDAKNWNRTINLALALLDKKPDAEIAEHTLFLLADARRHFADAAGAIPIFRQLIATYPRGTMIHQSRLGLARALLDDKQWVNAEGAARAGLAAIGNNVDAGELRDNLYLVLGEALLHSTKTAEAAAVFSHLETSPRKEIASQGFCGSATLAEQTQQWNIAASKWSRCADASTNSEARAKAHLRQGQAWRSARSGSRAMTAFDLAIAAGPRTDTAAQALYESASLARELNKLEDEAERWSQLITQFPQSKYSSEARARRSEVHYDRAAKH